MTIILKCPLEDEDILCDECWQFDCKYWIPPEFDQTEEEE